MDLEKLKQEQLERVRVSMSVYVEKTIRDRLDEVVKKTGASRSKIVEILLKEHLPK
jgi:metal-responsive CopG/Arc/MetJ family transcriptional regulator